MAFAIRASTSKDVDEIIELWKEFMNDPLSIDLPIPTTGENVKRQREFITKLVGEDARQVHVAVVEGRLVGYVVCQKVAKGFLEVPYKWGFITDLFVKRNYRHEGIGRKLMETCLEYLKSTGNDYVRLTVWSQNEGAAKLYRELGFKDHLDLLQLSFR